MAAKIIFQTFHKKIAIGKPMLAVVHCMYVSLEVLGTQCQVKTLDFTSLFLLRKRFM